MEGREGNLLTRTQIQSLRVSDPLDAPPRKFQLLATLCVALSFALFALGGANPTSRCCLRTLRFVGSSTIVGPIFDMIIISLDVASMICEEGGGGACKCMQHPLLHFAWSRRLSFNTVGALRTNDFPWAPLRPLAYLVAAFPSSSSCLEKGREKKGEKVKKKRLGI
jgi:hypothetical protein